MRRHLCRKRRDVFNVAICDAIKVSTTSRPRPSPLSLLQLPSAKINICLSLHRQTFSSRVKGDFIVGCFAEFSKYLLHLKPDGPHEAADDVEVVYYNILFLF